MSTRILIGDCRTVLAKLPAASVHCCVTSPPYFGLRDYGMAEQIGLERTLEDYVAEMVKVFREVRRVLRDDGTLWLNLGDSYASGGCGARDPERWPKQSRNDHMPVHGKTDTGLPAKQRLMIPARTALALQADGWWLRDEIIWQKPNPMPVSVTDRTTPAHEMLYMFAKSPRYYYDQEAIKEPISEASRKRYAQPTISEQKGGAKQDAYENGFVGQRGRSRRPNEVLASLAASGKDTRNKRSVWTIPTRPFKGAHFATFPPDLIEPCILAGCPEGGTVLDPFGGSGTTGLVAGRAGRDAILVELNPEYAAIAEERLVDGIPLFTPVAAERPIGVKLQ